jgi:hypothetical protein
MFGRLAHGNDADLPCSFGMGDHDYGFAQHAHCNKAPLTVCNSCVLKCISEAVQQRGRIGKIEAVFLDICAPFVIVPDDLYRLNYA